MAFKLLKTSLRFKTGSHSGTLSSICEWDYELTHLSNNLPVGKMK